MAHIIGIDLGTTYSAVATIGNDGRPYIIKNQRGSELTPSVIFFDSDGSIIVGADAKDKLQEGETNVAMFFKRNLGNSEFRFRAGSRDYSATDLSAILLKKLKEDAELALGEIIEEAVITVPAYFNNIQRTETIKAGKMAGLNVRRIINEPTAAAITYGISRDSVQKVLIYDLGGGTFDVTILEVTPKDIKVLATGGDHKLGGKDWDDCLLSYIVKLFKDEFGIDPSEELEAYHDLAYQCENLKKRLTQKQSDFITLRYQGFSRKYIITREKFEELTLYLMNSTQTKAEEVLADANLSWRDISGVLLVGGSTRMPMVENWVRKMFGQEPVRGVYVDYAVAMGAAVLAGQIQQKQFLIGGDNKPQFYIAGNKRIVDVMSHSLGLISVSEDRLKYVNSILIEKNKTIPITEKRPFRHIIYYEGTNDLEIFLTQGESSDVHDILVVSKYVLSGIQHVPGCVTNIEIEYSYNEDGVINVSGYQTEYLKKLDVRKVELPENMNWLFERPKGLAIPYSKYAGQSFISGAKTDQFGNPLGSEYDLAKNDAFKGYKIVIVDLCSDSTMNVDSPSKALQKKGFSVVVYKKEFPLQQLKKILDDNRSQLWIIANYRSHLSQECYKFVYDFFSSGRGLYLWSDNAPYFADTNIIIRRLFLTEMSGEYWGDQVLSIQKEENGPGIIKNHLITTGIQNFYEGITISNVRIDGGLKPLVYSSNGKIVTAYYDKDGKRCLVDGGFTRLFHKWDSAGTDRFVVNCAAWLANIERFGYYPDLALRADDQASEISQKESSRKVLSIKNILKLIK